MRLFRLSIVLASVCASGGCFQSTTLVKVNADGSGTIEQTTIITAAALAQLRLFAPPGSDGRPFTPFSEDQERSAAAQLGPGVTLVSSTPVQDNGGQGRRSIYAFTDITQLHVNQRPLAPGGSGLQARGINTDQVENIRFVLTHETGGIARLAISFPPQGGSNRTAPPDGQVPAPSRSAKQPTEGQLAMLKQMLKGMKVAVTVQPNGKLIDTNSPYVDGQIVTLVDLDFDQLINDDELLRRLQGARTIDEAKAVITGIPGLKVNLEGNTIIDFAPGR